MLNPTSLSARLRLPVIAAPMFLASGPELVTACCRAGICGTFPALNQRTSDGFADWLRAIEADLADDDNPAPFGVNLIVHKSNARLEADLKIVVAHKVPLVITSLGAVKAVVDAVHSYGGLVFHDVTNRRHAEKAVEAGVDGIIAVAAGAGGHAGTLSPFALVSEIRSFFSGPLALSGAISTGAHIAAARALGADFAYIGTRFLATSEAMAPDAHKQMIVEGRAADIVYTPAISGVPANFLRPSIMAAGLDPDNLPPHKAMNLASEAKA
ncbi:MAG: nitronate monooxygenase, partial [Martelella sp.]